jgi:hypothetical protein
MRIEPTPCCESHEAGRPLPKSAVCCANVKTFWVWIDLALERTLAIGKQMRLISKTLEADLD